MTATHSSRPIMTEGPVEKALHRLFDARAIGKRVRYAREMAGVTQAELGHAIDRSPATIYNVEVGRRRLTGRELVIFARVLGVGVAWLRGGESTARAVEKESVGRRQQVLS